MNNQLRFLDRYNWKSGKFIVRVTRISPKTFRGKNAIAFLGATTHAISERYIKDKFGGGIYDVVVRTDLNKSGVQTFLKGALVRIPGEPKLT